VASGGEITGLLAALRRGDSHAESNLAELVYTELHGLAQRHMRRERPDHTLQPTALVHEAYLRLIRDAAVEWHDRAHFYATASLAMRRILVDHARSRFAAKRPGARHKVELDDFLAAQNPRIEQLLILDEALTHLAEMDARQARVVEMIYFGGMSQEEVAAALGISVRTVKRDWRDARAWLEAELSRAASDRQRR
jgi:RNA polymerase sigma-70 factor, ECF subfamily